MIRTAGFVAAALAFLAFWLTLLGAQVGAAGDPQAFHGRADADPDAQQAPGGALMIHKRVWQGDSWKPATPAHSWHFTVHEGATPSSAVVATPTDADNTPLTAGTYTITEDGSPPNPAGFPFFALIVSTTGGSNCSDAPTPAVAGSLTITAAEFGPNGRGTVHVCAYNIGDVSGQVVKEFVREENGAVTWKLRPTTPGSYTVWDDAVQGCQAFGGALCGGIGSGGSGSFEVNKPGQHLLATQALPTSGACKVDNVAKYQLGSVVGATQVQLASASYTCSGATALGWPLLAVAFGGAVGVAVVARKRQWRR